MRKADLRAMRLLLDFGANPDAIIIANGQLSDPRLRERSLLAIAAWNGFADVAKLLLEFGANTNPRGMPPLIAALNNENREILAVLLEKNPSDVLKRFYDKAFLYHAIDMESNLLPVVATLVKQEIQKMKDCGAENVPKFPPKLKGKQRKTLSKALELNDTIITTEFIDNVVKDIKCPWKKLREDDFSSEEYADSVDEV